MIVGIVGGVTSLLLLSFIFFVLWYTRRRAYKRPKARRISSIQASTRSDRPILPILNVTPPDDKGDDDDKAGVSWTKPRPGTRGVALDRFSTV